LDRLLASGSAEAEENQMGAGAAEDIGAADGRVTGGTVGEMELWQMVRHGKYFLSRHWCCCLGWQVQSAGRGSPPQIGKWTPTPVASCHRTLWTLSAAKPSGLHVFEMKHCIAKHTTPRHCSFERYSSRARFREPAAAAGAAEAGVSRARACTVASRAGSSAASMARPAVSTLQAKSPESPSTSASSHSP
jgi:hypothetical protein